MISGVNKLFYKYVYEVEELNINRRLEYRVNRRK